MFLLLETTPSLSKASGWKVSSLTLPSTPRPAPTCSFSLRPTWRGPQAAVEGMLCEGSLEVSRRGFTHLQALLLHPPGRADGHFLWDARLSTLGKGVGSVGSTTMYRWRFALG